LSRAAQRRMKILGADFEQIAKGIV